MAVKLEKIKDVEYHELLTLVLLHKETKLWDIFKDEFKFGYPMLVTIAKNNGLSNDAQDVLRSIFDEIICTNKDYLVKYEFLLTNFDEAEELKQAEIARKNAAIATPETTSPSESYIGKPEKTAESVAESKVAISTPKIEVIAKKKPNRKLPRRMGKETIEKKIKERGGQALPLERLMLRLNDLKNMYSKLNARGIKAMHHPDESIIDDDDCRVINAAITILEQKVKPILNK